MTDQSLDLKQYGIAVGDVWRNAAPARLYEAAVEHDKAIIAASGALVSLSGSKTGRSPKDKRIVKHPASAGDIWWGEVNMPLDQETFETNRERAIDFLNFRSRLYVVDGFAGWSPKHRLKVRVICARPYHALFMHNMLIRPTDEELGRFRRARLRDLQRGRFPRQSAHAADDLEDQRRPELRERRVRDSGHRIRRRDEKRRVHDHELPDAQAGRALDALLGQRRRRRRRLAVLWSFRHRQDDAFGRSPAAC